MCARLGLVALGTEPPPISRTIEKQVRLFPKFLLEGKIRRTTVAPRKPHLFSVRLDSGCFALGPISRIRNFLGGTAPVALLELDAVLVKCNSVSEGANDVVRAGETQLDILAVGEAELEGAGVAD